MRITRPGGTDLTREAGRISDHDPVRIRGSAGPVRSLGRRARAHVSERRLRQRHRGVRARRHRRAAVLPLRAGRGAARHPRRLHPQDRGRARRQADERLAGRQQGQRAGHGRARDLASRLGPQSRRAGGMRSRSTAPTRSATTPAPAASPAISCSRPARTRKAAASAPPRGTTTCRCGTAPLRSTTTSSSSAASSPTKRCRSRSCRVDDLRSLRHSGRASEAKRGPESITAILSMIAPSRRYDASRSYGFRARRYAAPRNDIA